MNKKYYSADIIYVLSYELFTKKNEYINDQDTLMKLIIFLKNIIHKYKENETFDEKEINNMKKIEIKLNLNINEISNILNDYSILKKIEDITKKKISIQSHDICNILSYISDDDIKLKILMILLEKNKEICGYNINLILLLFKTYETKKSALNIIFNSKKITKIKDCHKYDILSNFNVSDIKVFEDKIYKNI